MIFSYFTLKYLTTAVLNIFRIKTNEYSISIKVCLAAPRAAPVDLTGNLPLIETYSHLHSFFKQIVRKNIQSWHNLVRRSEYYQRHKVVRDWQKTRPNFRELAASQIALG